MIKFDLDRKFQSSFKRLSNLVTHRLQRRFRVKPTKTPTAKLMAQTFEHVHRETTCLQQMYNPKDIYPSNLKLALVHVQQEM